jgi:hypothetical protein
MRRVPFSILVVEFCTMVAFVNAYKPKRTSLTPLIGKDSCAFVATLVDKSVSHKKILFMRDSIFSDRIF